jgi:hypothetical protein
MARKNPRVGPGGSSRPQQGRFDETATAAISTAHRLLELFRADEARLSGLGRSGPSVRQVFAALCRRPLHSIKHSAASAT